jgi:hypothetical protein
MRQLLKEEIKSVLTEKSFKKLLSESIKKEFISEGLLKYDEELFEEMIKYYERCFNSYYVQKLRSPSKPFQEFLEHDNKIEECKSPAFSNFYNSIVEFLKDYNEDKYPAMLDEVESEVFVSADINTAIREQFSDLDDIGMNIFFKCLYEKEEGSRIKFSPDEIKFIQENLKTDEVYGKWVNEDIENFKLITLDIEEFISEPVLIDVLEIYGIKIFAEVEKEIHISRFEKKDFPKITFFNDTNGKDYGSSQNLKDGLEEIIYLANDAIGVAFSDAHEEALILDFNSPMESFVPHLKEEVYTKNFYSNKFKTDIFLEIFSGPDRMTGGKNPILAGGWFSPGSYIDGNIQGSVVSLFVNWENFDLSQAMREKKHHYVLIRHELQHFEQSTFEAQKKLKFGQYGRPEKYVQDLDGEHQWSEEHAIRGVEFYTRLSDELSRILENILQRPPEHAKYIFLYYLAKTEFFQKIKEHRPVWYRKAIKLAWIEIEKEVNSNDEPFRSFSRTMDRNKGRLRE